MEEWKTYKIGDVCEISSSKRVFAEEYRTSGIPFYRGKEIIEKHAGNNPSTEIYIDVSHYNRIRERYGVPQEGDLLLTSVGTLGVPYVVKDETFYFKDGNLTWFKNFKGIRSEYLYYWFHSPRAKAQIDSKCIGSTQKALPIEVLRSFDICLPSLKTQDDIVLVLASIDNKIALNNRINHNLEEQAQALYKSWFVDFEPFKDGKFVNSELGLIPEGWHVGTLSELAKITMGQSPSGSSFNEEGNGFIFYQGRTEFGFRFPSIKLFTTDPTRFSAPKSILMSVRAPVGDINVSKKRCCIGRGLASIEPYIESYSFVLYTVKSQSEQLDMYNGEGTVFGSINRKELEGLSVIVPPEDIINSFNELVTPFDTKIEELSDENDNLQIERDTLLPQLMSGSLTC